MTEERKMKIIGIIQIRLGSTRLPKKAMLKILDKPIIWHIYNRLKFCKNLDQIVIATGNSENNLEIQDFAKKNNIPIFEGNEIDLVSRLYQTGEKFHASAIVRITGDSPLVDPVIVDQIISTYKKNIKKIDIVSNMRKASFPYGLEVEIFSMESLKKMLVKIKKPEMREWFSLFIEKNPNLFNILNISNPKDLSKLRWTLDYEENYKFIKKIYEELYIENEIFLMNDILKLINKNPNMSEINKKYVGIKNIGIPKNEDFE